MTRPAGVMAVVLLLFGPAALSVVSRRWGLISAACAVVILVWLVLREERRGGQ